MKNKPKSSIPDDAVLLIPESESKNAEPIFGVKPGYYNSKQMLELLNQHKTNSDAIRFIADMLETGNPEEDGFAIMLRGNCNNPQEIDRIIRTCLEG